jgi:glycosyltransferase involved in cell wall biosynthesis
MPTVSVIIPAYNGERFLREAIDGALGQTLRPQEVIVVDDGSRDSTPQLLAAYGTRVRAIRQENQGVAVARNHGAALASGDYLAFLDADDVWERRKLELQVARFRREAGLGLVHCGVQEIDAEGKPLAQRRGGMEGWVAPEMLMFRRAVVLGGGSGVMIPRELFRELGGFDPRLSTSADWDLYFRLARRKRVGFVSDLLVLYRLHSSNMHGNIRVMEHDMLHAYEKAFQDSDPELQRLRSRAYGNLHMVLAGSYFAVGQRREFVRHALKSMLITPDNALRLAGYPIRWLRRKAGWAEAAG